MQKETGWEDMDWIDVLTVKDKWQCLILGFHKMHWVVLSSQSVIFELETLRFMVS
jgi:hypothetical protein